MVLIPAGEVWVGLSQNQLDAHNEAYDLDTTLTDHTVSSRSDVPTRALTHQKVHIDAFYMDIHEVTVRHSDPIPSPFENPILRLPSAQVPFLLVRASSRLRHTQELT